MLVCGTYGLVRASTAGMPGYGSGGVVVSANFGAVSATAGVASAYIAQNRELWPTLVATEQTVQLSLPPSPRLDRQPCNHHGRQTSDHHDR